MKILAIGAKERVQELKNRLPLNDSIEFNISNGGEDDYKYYDVIFDLNFDDDIENLEEYAGLKNKLVFVSSAKLQLAEAAYVYHDKIKCYLIGLNALPTFIDRPTWELSLHQKYAKPTAEEWLKQLNIEHRWVEDRVGLVTPRVIFMIINEACYTLQEGTATIEDIDLGMKLGTNYPYGPFEWADRIGITDVFETLTAVYEDTKDERYKVCPLLKTQYLKNQPFYKK